MKILISKYYFLLFYISCDVNNIKIFDRKIKRTFLTENYINSCLDNLKLNNT